MAIAEGDEVWEEYGNSVHLYLASMLTVDNKRTSSTKDDSTIADDVLTSEDEPLAHICHDSDDEPLSMLQCCQHDDDIPLINTAKDRRMRKQVSRMDTDCHGTVNLSEIKKASGQEVQKEQMNLMFTKQDLIL